MKLSAYTIQRLSELNLNDLDKLHTAVYGKTPSTGLFFKKYDTAYTHVAYTGFIAYNEALLPIAFYGVIPCFMCCSGKVTLAAQSADTMTHPDYRSQGLFASLAGQTYELCREQGIKILFGFPNQNSLPGFINKLGWQTAESMDRFIIPVKTIPLEKLAVKVPFIKKIYKSYIKWVLKKYTMQAKGISNSVLYDDFDGVFRDADYLQYKTYSATQVIHIKGAAFWIKINNGLMIGDMSGIDTHNFKSIMSELVKLVRRLGIRQIQFHTNPHTHLHTLFAGHYKTNPSFPVILKPLDAGISTGKMKFTFADIDIF